jgi:hypothetical protein
MVAAVMAAVAASACMTNGAGIGGYGYGSG